VTGVFARFRAGDREAAGQLWRQYFPRLIALARHTLSGRPQQAADADDAVQSAFVSFWQRAQRDGFSGPLHRENLWNLLGVITVRKALKHQERERAKKRGGGRVLNDAGPAGHAENCSLQLAQALGELPAHEFDLFCEELLLMLDDEPRRIALLRLLGHGTAEIAAALDCTQRRVQRKLNLVRLRWEREFAP
jgi:RNA polymerase sigma factor (sigma-70 family)